MTNLTKSPYPTNQRSHMWKYIFDETWYADEPVTDEDIDRLEREHYHMFPVLSASFEVSEDRLTVTVHVEEDKCN